jgi:hypothetical protein
MDYHISKDSKGNDLPRYNKAEALKLDGAIETDATLKKNLVVVLKNIFGEGVAKILDEDELNYQVKNELGRKQTFLIYPPLKNE